MRWRSVLSAVLAGTFPIGMLPIVMVLLGTATAMATVTTVATVTAVAAPRPSPMPTAAADDPESPSTILSSLPWPVAVPSELPGGFELERLEVTWSRGAGAGYRLHFAGPDRTCFAIEAARGGFGGPVPERSRPLHPEAFAPAPGEPPYRLYWTEGTAGGGPFPEPTVLSDWLRRPDPEERRQGARDRPGRGQAERREHAPEELLYRLVSPVEPGLGCARVAPELAARIVESLRFLEAADRDGGDDEADFLEVADGDAGDEEADADRWDLDGYLSISSLRPWLDRKEGESAEELAVRALEYTGFPLPEAETGELAVEQTIETRPGPDDAVRVLVTRVGGGDDSVAATRYLVVLMPEEGDGWLFHMGRQFACHEGRGHSEWSQELCH